MSSKERKVVNNFLQQSIGDLIIQRLLDDILKDKSLEVVNGDNIVEKNKGRIK